MVFGYGIYVQYMKLVGPSCSTHSSVGMVILGDESQFTLTLLLTAAGLPGSEGKLGWPPHCLERG